MFLFRVGGRWRTVTFLYQREGENLLKKKSYLCRSHKFNSMRKLCMIFLLCISFSFTDSVSKASYYGKEHHGKKTASGERFDMNSFTAAHRSLKFGTKVKVTNIHNGKTVIVKINDRGPFVKSRSLDLSKAAFKEIEELSRGIVTITFEVLQE